MIPLHGFLPCFPVMTPYQSQTAFMFPLYVSLYVPLYVPRHDSLHVPLHVPRHDFLSNALHVPLHDFLLKDNAKR